MYVGVILSTHFKLLIKLGVPHVCGGDPNQVAVIVGIYRCSPCMWGWSSYSHTPLEYIQVFPMYVGVILSDTFCLIPSQSVPQWSSYDEMSLVTEAVFPMYVGVILNS